MNKLVMNEIEQLMGPFSLKELLLFVVSLIATFVSANTRLKPLCKAGIVMIFLAIILTYHLYTLHWNDRASYIVYGILFIVSIYFIFRLSAKSNIHNKKVINRQIIRFTKQADTKAIKLFGGDVDFLGDVKDDSISKNKQYKQLKEMNFRTICMICLTPKREEDKLRLGFLLSNFGRDLNIKFFDETNCDQCSTENQATNKCSVNKLKKTTIRDFHVDTPYCKNPCNNPDLRIRGRIITKSKNGAESVFITVKEEKFKKYRFKEYDREDEEGNTDKYLKLWEIWWNRCAAYPNIQEECKKAYKDMISQNNL